MNTKHTSFRGVILGLFLVVSVFGFAITTAYAYDFDQPNYGDGIAVDGDISDWDLAADHFSVMYRDNDTTLQIDADAYLRYDTMSGNLFILVLARNGQVVRTINGQIVEVDGVRLIQSPYLDPTNPQEFAWVNINGDGTLAEGWEAAVPLSSDPPDHQIFIHTLLENNDKAWVDLPINIYTWDYGDLSDTYGTLLSSNGPKHTAGELRLGSQVDGESDGQPSDGTLDDLTSRNDEDGVEPIGNWLSVSPTISYTVNGCSGDCYLNLWIDWDGDNTFNEAYDTVFTGSLVTNGTHSLTFPLPYEMSTFPENLNARVRLCDSGEGCATPHALSIDDAPFGEVEDYQWSFYPNAISLNSFTAASTQNSIASYVIVGFIAVVLFVGAMVLLLNKRRKQEVFS